jgi:hypothetical protein
MSAPDSGWVQSPRELSVIQENFSQSQAATVGPTVYNKLVANPSRHHLDYRLLHSDTATDRQGTTCGHGKHRQPCRYDGMTVSSCGHGSDEQALGWLQSCTHQPGCTAAVGGAAGMPKLIQ